LRDDYTAATNTNPSATDRNVWKFELRNIRPGHYILYALYRDNPLNGQKRHIGHVAVNVGNQDVGGVTIPISEGVELRARVTGNGDTAAQSQVPQQLTLRSRDGLPTNLQPAPQPLNAPGAGNWRVFPGLTEGNYVLDSPLVTLRDAYVADIRQGDKSNYESGTITIGSGTPDPLEVILARPAGTITGKVQSASGPATAGVRVALIPNGPRRENPMLFKRATTNADGQITLMGIAPGEYKLFAWDNIPNGAELNADFMKDYEDRGTPVTITAGKSLEVVLPLIVEKHR
jgi:hypothetical protein